MVRFNSKRKTRSDKFPLTIHLTSQYCKKIKSELCYFGSDKKRALDFYLEQAAYLYAGKLPFLLLKIAIVRIAKSITADMCLTAGGNIHPGRAAILKSTPAAI
ncbi:hypothetical protein ES703_56798 [subsurface metagenome]